MKNRLLILALVPCLAWGCDWGRLAASDYSAWAKQNGYQLSSTPAHVDKSDPRSLFNAVRAQENKVFGMGPSSLFAHLFGDDAGTALGPPDTSGHFYTPFTPSHSAEPDHALLTWKVVEGLQNGKKALSVGAGRAFLEQTLILGFDVKPQSLELADIADKGMPVGMKHHLFDMTRDWPADVKGYDYVLFPESLIASGSHQGSLETLARALKACNPSCELRMSGSGIARDQEAAVRAFFAGRGERVTLEWGREYLVGIRRP